MDPICARINEVVISSGMSKTAFGKEINLSQSMISKLCSGAASPSDRTISDICRRYNIDEVWLRTGEGKMVSEKMSKETLRFLLDPASDLFPEDMLQEFITSLSKLPWRKAMEILQKLLDESRSAVESLEYPEKESCSPQEE